MHLLVSLADGVSAMPDGKRRRDEKEREKDKKGRERENENIKEYFISSEFQLVNLGSN